MPIIINIDVMLAKRKMSVTELAERVGITIANMSVLKNGKAKAVRLSTLEAVCKALQCQPGDHTQLCQLSNGLCLTTRICVIRADGRGRRLLAQYREVELLVRVGEYQRGNDAEADDAVARRPGLEAFLCQGYREKSDFRTTLAQLRKAVEGPC